MRWGVSIVVWVGLGCAGAGPGRGPAADGATADGGAGGGPDGGGAGDGGGGGGDPSVEPALVDAALPADDGADLRAPGRGFAPEVDLLGPPEALAAAAGGARLVYARVGLGDYRSGPLDAAALDAVEAGLTALEDARLHAILRVHYTGEDSAADAPAPVVAAHLEQLAPLLAEAPSLLAVQAGFLGADGSWSESAHGHLDSPELPAAVVDALLRALPAEVPVQVRTPVWKHTLTGGPVTADTAFSGVPAARVGHHNDCALSSDTDGGTYPPDAVAAWTDFVAAESRFVPVGGEVCAPNPPRTDCAGALATLESLGFVYLTEATDPAVRAAWSDGGCADTLAARLGHRLVVRAARASEAVAPGGVLRLVVDLENTGFAPTVRAQHVVLVVGTPDGEVLLPLDFVDTRRLAAGRQLRLDLHVQVPAGTDAPGVSLALRLTDPLFPGDPAMAVPLGRAAGFDPSTGDNLLFPSVRVDRAAPGARDPTADLWGLLP